MPTPHGWQGLEPSERVPGAQAAHAVEPGEGEKLPASQGKQPEALPNCPEGQGLQAPEPAADHEPRLQGEQAVEPAALKVPT